METRPVSNQSTSPNKKQKTTSREKSLVLNCELFDEGCSIKEDRITNTSVTKRRRDLIDDLGTINPTAKHLKSEHTLRNATGAMKRLNEKKAACIKEIDNFIHTEINKKLDNLREAAITKLNDDINHLTASEVDAAVISFERNTNITEFLNGINSLGECFIRTSQLNVDDAEETMVEAPTNTSTTSKPHHQPRYSIQKQTKHNIRLADDEQQCSIFSSAILDSGDILLADNNNNNLKLVDCASFDVKASLKLNGSPWAVSMVNSTQVVVSLIKQEESVLQFVDTDDGILKPAHSLQMNHCCIGVAVCGRELFVTDLQRRVYVYTIEGQLQYEIGNDAAGHNNGATFSCSLQICVSHDREFIHVTDRNYGLITLDTHNYLTHGVLKQAEAWGVTADQHGNVFVSASNSHTVVVIASSGCLLCEVLTAANGLKQPKAVCFDTNNSRLYVNCHLNDELFVVDLNYA